ncbi:MAG: YeeE/YedE family protein [Bacteroidales bacterium]|nr:YeeE/YedE family protein [Bacteroidales bacterium]
MNNTREVKKYMNPYLAGFILGLSLLAALYFTGRGLGASGAVKSTVTTVVNSIAPEHAQNSHFYSKYIEGGKNPMSAWLVFEILGVIFGGLISGAISGRLKFKIEHSPKISAKTRIIVAVIGGFFVGIGASLGRGCASGAAMSGMAVLSTAGFISFIAIFGTAFLFAYFFRKLWI